MIPNFTVQWAYKITVRVGHSCYIDAFSFTFKRIWFRFNLKIKALDLYLEQKNCPEKVQFIFHSAFTSFEGIQLLDYFAYQFSLVVVPKIYVIYILWTQLRTLRLPEKQSKQMTRTVFEYLMENTTLALIVLYWLCKRNMH